MKNIFYSFLVVALFACNKKTVPPPAALMPVPTKEQLAWQEKELYAFIHFTVNTFTDKEWGYGDESPNVFNPVKLDAEQWVKVLKETGFQGAILTAKHHDGFCLWPSKFTEHSVKNSIWREGKGDVVAELKNACDKHQMPLGIYLSPWDRNHSLYAGSGYIDYYQNQLNELLDSYGPIFEIWFDGANGGDGYYGGAREMRKIDDKVYYDWPKTFKIVKSFNPKTIIRGDARTSSDSRWCGNEEGYIGETNWNLVTSDSLIALGKDKKRLEILNTGDENGKVWMPAEVDVSIRPGWFYHESEDKMVKTPDELFDIYLKSVGRGAPLLLNVAPDKRGLIPYPDVQSLREWKKKIDHAFANNLAVTAKIAVNSYRGKSDDYGAKNLTDDNKETFWATDNNVITGTIECNFDVPKKVQFLVLQEYIKLGQRVKSFVIEVAKNGKWEKVSEGTTIGFKRIVRIDPIETSGLRFRITDSKACPVISNFEIY